MQIHLSTALNTVGCSFLLMKTPTLLLILIRNLKVSRRDGGLQKEELQELVQQCDTELNADDYVNADEDLPTCDTYDNNANRREELLEEMLSGGHACKETSC